MRFQEELNRLDKDISIAADFADQLEKGDEVAEKHVDSMMDWIIRGLMFERETGDFPGTFRFRYNTGAQTSRRTLMDVASFLAYCYPALEEDQPDPSNPVTVHMSASREVASHGRQVHPMRYGSPFVDHIFRFMADDPRGISTAVLRYASDVTLEEPTPFLGITLLVSLADGSERPEIIRQLDEEFKPRIVNLWVDGRGSVVHDDHLIALLQKPYEKNSSLNGYQDINIRSERWSDLEEYFPWRLWPQLIDGMTDNIESHAKNLICEAKTNDWKRLKIACLSAKFLVLVGH